MRGPKLKTLLIILLPIVLSGLITTLVSMASSKRQLEARALHFGNAVAEQMALTVVEPMVQKDLLSLNVILTNLLDKGSFQFASVYSSDNRLLAQSGKNTGDMTMFTRDVVFQSAATGFVQLGMDNGYLHAPMTAMLATAIVINAAVIAFICVAVWFYGDLLYFWWSAPPVVVPVLSVSTPANPTPVETPEEIDDISGDLTILVIKVRPARQLEANIDRITRALSLYRGEVEITDGDDFVITFTTSDQVFQAICCGLLIQAIMRQTRGSIHVKLGLHVAALTRGEDTFKATKHATYLASISDDKLLVSRQARNKMGNSDRVALEPFHSSLTPDGEVYCMKSLTNTELIERQARQFV